MRFGWFQGNFSRIKIFAGSVLIALSASVVLAAPARSQVVTIQHVATGRLVDAHVTADQDYRIVTRHPQNNNTQRWTLTNLGGGNYTIAQRSNGRYWDAHVTADRDYEMVTRTAQNNNTQRWRLTTQGGGIYSIVQVSTGRFVDAYGSGAADKDFRLVTRPFQDNNTQRWRIKRVSSKITNCLPGIKLCF